MTPKMMKPGEMPRDEKPMPFHEMIKRGGKPEKMPAAPGPMGKPEKMPAKKR
jgi:hypothetical protein